MVVSRGYESTRIAAGRRGDKLGSVERAERRGQLAGGEEEIHARARDARISKGLELV
jgi:hypothetical protein